MWTTTTEKNKYNVGASFSDLSEFLRKKKKKNLKLCKYKFTCRKKSEKQQQTKTTLKRPRDCQENEMSAAVKQRSFKRPPADLALTHFSAEVKKK